jgi:hypothetical protein
MKHPKTENMAPMYSAFPIKKELNSHKLGKIE